MIGIYKITNPKGKTYIGQSTDLKKREETYSRLNCKHQIKLYNSILKYSWEQHIFEIIEECSLEQLNEREIYWGLYCDVLGENGLNLKLGDAKGICSEETKQKMSQTHKTIDKSYIHNNMKGKTHSEETKQKMSQSRKDKPKPWVTEARKGKPLSEETKQNISKSLIGKKQSKETIEKRSNSLKGQKRSDYTKQLMSEAAKGKIITWGDKISEAKKNSTYRHPKEIMDKIAQIHSKPIEQYTPDGKLLNTYPSAMEAMRQTGIKNDNINQNLRGKSKSAGGFVWKYKE
jgi:group I intron endonuclease